MDYEREINYELCIILEETVDNNIKVRQKAEEKLKIIAEENLGELLIDLGKNISNIEIKKEIRQISSNLFQNILSLPRFSQLYLDLSSETKNQIKEQIFQGFNNNEIYIRISAALAICTLAKIEIPKNQFLYIFDLFYENIQKKNINIQLTTIIAINFILKEVKNNKIVLLNESIPKIIDIYYLILNKYENNEKYNQLILDTLKSIKLNLSFIIEFILYTNKNLYFYNLLHKHITNKSTEIRNTILSIFLELIKDYYDTFEYYIDIIIDFTYNIAENDIAKNKLICIKIWNSIGIIEEKRLGDNKKCLNFLQKYYKPLTEISLKYIVTTEYENMDSDNDLDNEIFNVNIREKNNNIINKQPNHNEQSLADSCYFLIKLMSKCCDFDFVEKMIKYFYKYQESKDINYKYSAFNIFKAILETKHKSKLYPFICKNLDYIYNLINNSQIPYFLQKLCAKYLRSFSFFFIDEIIDDNQIFEQLMNYLLILIKISPKVIIYISLGSINNLCKGIKYNGNDMRNKLSQYIESLVKTLLSFGANIFLFDNKINIPITSFKCISVLAERTPVDCKVQMINTFRIIIEMFHSTLKKKKFKDEKIRLIFQEKISLCLSSFFISGSVDKKGIDLLFQYIIKSIRQRGYVFEEILKLVGSIALFIKTDFKTYFPQFKEHLIQGLKAFNKYSICKSSLLCLGEIIDGLGKDFNNYINDFMPIIINIIADNKFDILLKPECLNIIRYIFIFCPKEALKSFDIVMQIIGSGIQALQFKLNCKIDEETQIYFNELRDHLLETLSCVFCVIQEINKINEFLPFAKPIINFINYICDDINIISTNVNKSCLKLIINFCQCYGNVIKPFINFKLVKVLIIKLEEKQNPNDFDNYQENKKFIEWSKRNLNKILTD